jgi:outer membrane receptor protein involved in Fe transport
MLTNGSRVGRCFRGSLIAWLLAGSVASAQGVSTASIAGTVKDEGGGALPGVTVTATQAATGVTRTGVTSDAGDYTLQSLPVGPYKLEFALQGFRTLVQTGIVLEVGASPTINTTMAIGGLSESVQVEAATPLVETRSPGIATVVDNQRIVELPLNGRQTLDLVLLTGMAAPSGTLGGIRGSGGLTTISVAGGLPNATTYMLDGGNHNDPLNNAPMPFPFPEALQEFKVETSALPAQYGYHSAATVNAVTKSGTNSVHGSAFEFLRDSSLNATDPFSPLGADGNRLGDGLNRNQFGGLVGGPIARNRLFYLAGYQRTRIRRAPTTTFQFVPTPAMMAGDFTAFVSPACNAGRQIALRGAPFVNNKINPALFSPASVKLVGLLSATADPCGKVFVTQRGDSDEDNAIARLDYTINGSHSMFGRMLVTKFDSPGDYNGTDVLSATQGIFRNRSYSFVYGDSMVFGSNTVNELRATVNRGNYRRIYRPFIDFTNVGVKATPVVPGEMRVSVSGGFSLLPSGQYPAQTPTWTSQAVDDVSIVRGRHQFGFGGNYIYTQYDSQQTLAAIGSVNFTGQTTGTGLTDFLLGRASSFSQGSPTGINMRQHYLGAYGQDSWRLSSQFTLNAGLRWEPYIATVSTTGAITHFDLDRFTQGIRSTVFTNAPAGLMFPGDDGYPGSSIARNRLWQFAPRVATVWDPTGEGRQTLRAAYGRFYDLPHLQLYGGLANNSPWGNSISVTNLPAGWDDPYVAYPGGNPVPFPLSKNMQFPAFASYTTYPLDLRATNTDQWNVSYQLQVRDNWMVSANYLTSYTHHVWTSDQINPAVYIPGASTLQNINARRVLSLQNPVAGQLYSSIQQVTDDGTSTYRGLLLSTQRRFARGFSLQGNYTISRCMTDRANLEPGIAGAPYTIPGNRAADYGHCPNSPDHNVNLSAVYQIPAAGSSAVARALTGDWQVSGILSAATGSYLTVTTGVDNALTGQPNQRANQILDDPFMPNQSFSQWLNPAAFQAPAPGTYGTMPIDAFRGPGRWNVDMSLTRSFSLASEQLQLRLEAFNVFNHINPSNPVTTLNSSNFGQITSIASLPRIVQLAVKYIF